MNDRPTNLYRFRYCRKQGRPSEEMDDYLLLLLDEQAALNHARRMVQHHGLDCVYVSLHEPRNEHVAIAYADRVELAKPGEPLPQLPILE